MKNLRLKILAIFCLSIFVFAGCKYLPLAKKEKEEQQAIAKPLPPPAEIFSVGGMYEVKGTNPDGTPYSGTVKISQAGSVYLFGWNVGASYGGIGIRNKNILAVSWGSGKEAVNGIVLYTINPDGSLEGSWATPQSTMLGTEKLTPQI